MSEYFRSDNYAPLSHSSPIKNTSRSRHRRPVEWPNDPYNHARGETALWAAVITQAMMDALSRAVTAEVKYFKHEATVWLTGNSRDFRTVCECAGFDPGYVRRMAKRALSSPRQWRAEPGTGKRYLERREYRRRNKNDRMSNQMDGDWWTVNDAQTSPITIHLLPATIGEIA
ncbi:MAG: hypothetical protein KGI29_08590 [Pseudomonadota bacterium]|nr:hypothetical protein [Pseudomonadota bacterium]MDE3037811.1 hypothetical protein [Pseudomonadota bacterium]